MDQQHTLNLVKEETHRILKLNISNRLAKFPENLDAVKVAIGIRRAGKSYVMAQEMQKHLNQGANIDQFFVANFEDDRLKDLNAKQLSKLIDGFFNNCPENFKRTTYFLFDEVQLVDGWPSLVRRLFDDKNKKIYVTGSSAKMLSKEIASSLRGRSFANEIFPYNFYEYLNAKGSNFFTDKKVSPLEKQALTKQALHELLRTGGFPALIQVDEQTRLQMLRGYLDTIIVRDVAERHKIANSTLFRHLIDSLVNSAACPFTINKFYQSAKSRGYKVGKDTLYEYLSYIEDAFLSFAVPIFTDSLRKAEVNPKKMYLSDFGFMHLYGFEFENLSRRFENLVYLDLRRAGHEIFYFKSKENTEVDFIAVNRTNQKKIIQVCYDTSDEETLRRETQGLKDAEKELGVKGMIVTPDNYLEFLSGLEGSGF